MYFCLSPPPRQDRSCNAPFAGIGRCLKAHHQKSTVVRPVVGTLIRRPTHRRNNLAIGHSRLQPVQRRTQVLGIVRAVVAPASTTARRQTNCQHTSQGEPHHGPAGNRMRCCLHFIAFHTIHSLNKRWPCRNERAPLRPLHGFPSHAGNIPARSSHGRLGRDVFLLVCPDSWSPPPSSAPPDFAPMHLPH